MSGIIITNPFDAHVHFRDGEMMNLVAPMTASQFAGAIVMPNLKPPITTSDQAAAYRKRLMTCLPDYKKQEGWRQRFTPYMTCYLTDNTDPDDLERGFKEKIWLAAKLYPQGATTNSDEGVTEIKKIWPVLERMQEIGMPLLIHGEVTDKQADIFDLEKLFIDQILISLIENFPELKITMEHVTTKQAVQFVQGRDQNLKATVTAHHLMINRNAILRGGPEVKGGICPEYYCLPVAKREEHRLALRRAVTSGDERFGAGTDTAPHNAENKFMSCGCAGVFTGHAALELYYQVFHEELYEEANSGSGKRPKLKERFENFTCFNMPDYYGITDELRQNNTIVTISATPWEVPEKYGEVIPFMDGRTLPFKATVSSH